MSWFFSYSLRMWKDLTRLTPCINELRIGNCWCYNTQVTGITWPVGLCLQAASIAKRVDPPKPTVTLADLLTRWRARTMTVCLPARPSFSNRTLANWGLTLTAALIPPTTTPYKPWKLMAEPQDLGLSLQTLVPVPPHQNKSPSLLADLAHPAPVPHAHPLLMIRTCHLK